jgi:hypothetical protein
LSHYSKAPAAVLFESGGVLVAGGANGTDGTLSRAWVYDPFEDRFVSAEDMHVRRMAHSAVKLTDGRVLVAGGWSDSLDPSASTGSIELYDPDSGNWELLPVELGAPRHDHVMILLDDCRVLVAGGQQVLPDSAPVAPKMIEIITVPSPPA